MINCSRSNVGREQFAFDVQHFLNSGGVAGKLDKFQRGEAIFTQSESSNSVIYIQKGAVRLSVVHESGKEAVVAVLGKNDFFGEECLVGHSFRRESATAIASTSVLVIEKKEMIRVLHAELALSYRFLSYVLGRKIRIEEDLVDQHFNSGEKRLARTLLLLARDGQQRQPQSVLTKINQVTLAEMIGTSRSRVNVFMNKFKRLGYIRYNGGLQINSSLLRRAVRIRYRRHPQFR